MRNHLYSLAPLAFAAGLLIVLPGEAQQGSTPATAAGQSSAAAKSPFAGVPPTITNKPIDVSSVKSLSLQNPTKAQQQSTKVFDFNAAYHSMKSTLVTTTPKKSVVRPGPHNPAQPTKAAQVPPPKAASPKLLGFIPWF